MCKFCNQLFTGNVGNYLSDMEIEFNGIPSIGIQTYLEDDGNDPYLITVCDRAPDGKILVAQKISISYCPICGRKLK